MEVINFSVFSFSISALYVLSKTFGLPQIIKDILL